MKLFLLFAVFMGVTFILYNQLAAANSRRLPVEYRYLPRDLDTYMRTETLASVQFEDMFGRARDGKTQVSGGTKWFPDQNATQPPPQPQPTGA